MKAYAIVRRNKYNPGLQSWIDVYRTKKSATESYRHMIKALKNDPTRIVRKADSVWEVFPEIQHIITITDARTYALGVDKIDIPEDFPHNWIK